MSNEIVVQTSLQIKRGQLVYQSQPTAFKANMAGVRGPTPGAILVTRQGTDVNLSALVLPGGICRIQNLDLTNFVTYGIHDPVTNKFFPLGELLPGETYTLRLSRELGSEYGTGTGTADDIIGTGDTLRMKADTADCVVLVEAFDR